MISLFTHFCRKYAKWIPVLFVLFTVLLILLTLTPGDLLLKKMPHGSDKLYHATFFYTWTILFWLAAKIRNHNLKLPLWMILAIASLMGITIELLQYLLPVDREMDLYDVAANTVGICIALFSIWYMRQKKMVEEIILHS